MKTDTLTDNGVEKLIGGVAGVVLQVINITLKTSSNQKYYKCELSDGYCVYKNCLIVDPEMVDEGKGFKDYVVITVLQSMMQQNKNKERVVFVEKGQILDTSVVRQIGEPISYEEYVKNGKQNERGNNLIKNGKTGGFSKRQYEEMMDQPESTSQMHNNRGRSNHSEQNRRQPQRKAATSNNQSRQMTNNQPKQNNSNQSRQININNNQNNSRSTKPANTNRNGNLRLSQEEENTNRHSSLDNNQNSNINRSNLQQNNKANNNKQPNNNNNNNNRQAQSSSKGSKSMPKPPDNKNKGPIEKLPQRKKEAVVKGNQKRPSNHYNEIKSLFVGMENWTILVRVLFVYPMKTFINKKGVQSCLLKLTVGDGSGTIECTMFGETAQRFEGKFKQDQIYEISNGVVNESIYMGKRQLKITITENAKVCLSEDDDTSIPYSEEMSVTVQQLLEVPLGQTQTVVCLVKDSGQIQNITTKAGKQLRKKLVMLCDPQSKVQVQANVWGEKCDEHFQSQPYIIKGVYASEYNGNRQYTLKTDFAAKIVKQHKYRKYIKELDSIPFVCHGSDKKAKQQIHNFKELNNLMEIEGSKGVWTELVCSVGAVKGSAKNYYLSCPHCKKKVQEETNSQCGHCHASYEEARPRYILNVMLSDMYDCCWVTAYDEQAEVLTGIPASEFARLNDEGLQELLRKIRYKDMKMLLLTKNEQYNKEMRRKTGVIKVMNVNYGEETKSLLARLRGELGG